MTIEEMQEGIEASRGSDVAQCRVCGEEIIYGSEASAAEVNARLCSKKCGLKEEP